MKTILSLIIMLFAVNSYAFELDANLGGKQVKDYGIGSMISMIMLSFMEGDLGSIQNYFKVAGQLSADGWHISLEPAQARLKAAFNHIDLSGNKYLSQVDIHEHGDHRTLILFSSVHQIENGKSVSDASTDEYYFCDLIVDTDCR